MDKRLLLLGALRGQKSHGYGLLEYLNNHQTGGAAIGKSNAYRLLKRLEEDGHVAAHVEREGNRPERHVYNVTPSGESLFAELLAESLAEDATAEQPGIAVLNYIDEIEPEVAAEQLQTRLNKVAERHATLKDLPDEVWAIHPALDLCRRQMELEVDWLQTQVSQLKRKAASAA